MQARLSERKDWVQRAKQGGRPVDISLWKRAGCQTEWKALDKSIVDRIVQGPDLGLLNPSKMDWERYRIWFRVDRPGRKPVWQGERMKLDSRKKSRRDRMMRSKSFWDAGGERDRPDGSRRVERLSHLVNGNNRRCLPDGRKGMQRPGKIEDEKKKIHARARKVL